MSVSKSSRNLYRAISLLLVLVLTSTLISCKKSGEEDERTGIKGFLSLDMSGVSVHPFQPTCDIAVEWGEEQPIFVALPIVVIGAQHGDTFVAETWGLYDYEKGTSDSYDAYYDIIELGYQERFEELWTEVYDKLNGVEEFSEINAGVLSDILQHIYQDEKYGNLRDIVTDCLVLVNDINTNGPSDEYNQKAGTLYNNFYTWLCNISAVDL